MLSNTLGANGVAVASKKLFRFDMDYLLVAILFLLVLFSAKAMAFSITAPDSIEINDKAIFYVELINDSASAVDLKVSFHSPANATVVVPKQLAPNSKTTAKISIINNFKEDRQISGLVEVHFGTKIITKDINLIFSSTTNNTTSSDSALSGLFSFGSVLLSSGTSLTEFNLFTPLDWVIFILLVIICAVLLVSFIARIKRRA
jgi:hypothetical protein